MNQNFELCVYAETIHHLSSTASLVIIYPSSFRFLKFYYSIVCVIFSMLLRRLHSSFSVLYNWYIYIFINRSNIHFGPQNMVNSILFLKWFCFILVFKLLFFGLFWLGMTGHSIILLLFVSAFVYSIQYPMHYLYSKNKSLYPILLDIW